MPTALVFGVGGFVGRWLVEDLTTHGYEVMGADVLASCDVKGLAGYRMTDLTSYPSVRDTVDSASPDAIINLAAVSSVGASWGVPMTAFEVNAGGTLHVLEAVRDLGLQGQTTILIVGSSEEYAPSSSALNEESPLDATNPYGVSKANQERIAGLYASSFGLRIVRARSFNHTGPGQTDRFVLPSFCKQAARIASGECERVVRVGNVDVERDFSDVRDVVRAYRMLLADEHCVGKVFNVGSGHARSLRDLVATIASFAGPDIRVETDPERFRPTDARRIVADISRIDGAVGWHPERSLDATLREMYETYLDR